MKTFKTILKEFVVPNKEDTLGISRKDMPQIDSKDMKHFLNHLKDQDINVDNKEISPHELTATQHHFNKEKIKSMIDDLNNDKLKSSPILTSKDDYVIDGHHRWLAHKNINKPIEVNKIDLPVDELVDLMHDYERSYTKKLHERAFHVSRRK